jgi:hypothetical protein
MNSKIKLCLAGLMTAYGLSAANVYANDVMFGDITNANGLTMTLNCVGNPLKHNHITLVGDESIETPSRFLVNSNYVDGYYQCPVTISAFTKNLELKTVKVGWLSLGVFKSADGTPNVSFINNLRPLDLDDGLYAYNNLAVLTPVTGTFTVSNNTNAIFLGHLNAQ